MPQPPADVNDSSINRLIFEELNYNRADLKVDHDKWVRQLTAEQKIVYQKIITAVLNKTGGVFFVDGFGGTGKTFLWKVLSAAIRYREQIFLNVASSGIAALLLPGGRTAHSRFGIPINPNDFSTCKISRGSHLGDLVERASLIIWDEAPMMSKYCFESLDRSLRDIIKDAADKPFGGKVVVFGGDFRQILPVIKGAGRQETVMSALNASDIWDHVTVLPLTKNMRLIASENPAVAQEIQEFSDFVLAVVDGKINSPNNGEVMIDIPDEFLIVDQFNDPIESICVEIYGNSTAVFDRPGFFQERAILCPTNEDVDIINIHMLSKLATTEKTYLSADSIDPTDTSPRNAEIFSPDFLNTVKLGGLPNHVLRLKVGAPVMLLRNTDPQDGMCNGTRLRVIHLADHVVQAVILTGNKVGQQVFITRMTISPTDASLPFRMRRRQFPLSVAFAMTINKSQGQTLDKVGIFLPRPLFSHGQLYVAMFRVTSKAGLRILITDKEGQPQTKTKNVVFKEVFTNLK